MVVINRKNDLKAAMWNWVIKENQAEINSKNGVNLGTLYFYIISSNPKKWVGDYGRVGYHGSADGKILVKNKGEERIAARILNFPADRLIHRSNLYRYNDTYSRHIFIFDGDWIKVCQGLYYSKELDNYYWTGDRFDGNTWHGSEWSERIKAYIADYSNSYYSTSHFWDWCEEHYLEEPEVDPVLENKKEFIANTIRTISQNRNNIIGKDLWWQNGDGVHYIGYWRRNDEIILEFSEVDIDEVYNALSDVNTGVSIEHRACGYVFGIGWEE